MNLSISAELTFNYARVCARQNTHIAERNAPRNAPRNARRNARRNAQRTTQQGTIAIERHPRTREHTP